MFANRREMMMTINDNDDSEEEGKEDEEGEGKEASDEHDQRSCKT